MQFNMPFHMLNMIYKSNDILWISLQVYDSRKCSHYSCFHILQQHKNHIQIFLVMCIERQR